MQLRTAAPSEWRILLELALKHLEPEIQTARIDHLVDLLARGIIDPGGVFGAWKGPTLRGVQVCVLLPGASGLFWLPQTRPDDLFLEESLVQHGLDWLRGRGAKLAQALVSLEDSSRAGSLLRRGFRLITRLRYFEHCLQDSPSLFQRRLTYSTYSEANRAIFHETLRRSYEGTLDCPEIEGTRTLDEIIAGHRGQGGFDPQRWFLAWEEGRAVAVGMLAELDDPQTWDLSYLGVVPESRRRGVGKEMAGHLVDTSHKAGAAKLTLAVDERNEPARRLYESLGFVSGEQREVYLYFWRAPVAAERP